MVVLEETLVHKEKWEDLEGKAFLEKRQGLQLCLVYLSVKFSACMLIFQARSSVVPTPSDL